MIRPIITDRFKLTRKSDLVPFPLSEDHILLAKDLMDTAMNIKSQCIGLAAPQIDQHHRMIIARLGHEYTIMVNPEIIATAGKNLLGKEGCLSVPGTPKKPLMVRRWFKVTVKYQDLDGNEHTRKLKSLDARVAQHEIDHLDGILIR